MAHTIDHERIHDDLIDSLIAGEEVGRLSLANELSEPNELIDVHEALMIADASIDALLDLQTRIRERAKLHAMRLLDTPRGKDALSDALEAAREDADERNEWEPV